MKIKLLDNSEIEFDQPMSISDIAKSISISLGKKTIAGMINNEFLMPADSVISKDVKLEFITENSPYERSIASYTGALVTGLAIRNLYDNIRAKKYERGSNGIFSLLYDCEPFKKEDLQKIQEEIDRILEEGTEFRNTGIDFKEDPYVYEYVKENAEIHKNDYHAKIYNAKYIDFSLFTLGDFNFLPSYAMYRSSKKLKVVKILSSSAFLKEENGKVYQKIEGFATSSEEFYKEWLEREEEKRRSDHRYIGKQLEIFTLDPLIGQGLPIWLPNGTILKDEIKKYLKEKEWEYDFIQVQTPVIGTSELYKTSGHWDHYRDDMFSSMKLENNEEMVLKPMSCPHHISIYNYKQRSYRELPLRLAEHALQHRYESSGSLTGLERVRAMELTDSHIFCRNDQIKDEFKNCYKLIEEVLKTFGIEINYLSFSVRDKNDKEKYFNDDNMWDTAEKQLQEVLDELGLEYKRMEGEAAFYGPKLDIQAKTVLGHEITVSTIQLDFLLPSRFDLKYVNKEGSYSRPVMIHRGLVGTYERFVSILLEQSKGVLPLWLAPKQVEIIPINNEKHLAYCEKIKKEFKELRIRSNIDLREERLNYKIRDAQTSKIPYLLVIGNEEENNNTVTYRKYGETDQYTVSLEEFINKIKKEIKNKE